MNTLAPMNFDRTLILHNLDADLMKREQTAPATFVKAPNDSVFDLFFFFFFFLPSNTSRHSFVLLSPV